MITINNILDVEKYIDDVDAVIFDLDDTLYSEKEYVRSGYNTIAKAYPNIDCMADRLWTAFLAEKPAIDYVLDKENLLAEKENCLRIYRTHQPQIHLFPGVREMIDRIKQNKKVAIITDGRPEGQRAKLQALKLIGEEFIITDELGGVAFRKPCEQAFLIMQKRLNISFEKSVYIGDNIQKDFIAPEKLGMKTIYFKNEGGLYA